MLFLIRITHLHRDQRVVVFPVQHVKIVGKQIHHVNVSKIIKKRKKKSGRNTNVINAILARFYFLSGEILIPFAI